MFSIVYHAGTFKEPRYSASYGVMWDYLNISESAFGMTCGLEGSWGLAPSGFGGLAVLVGPNLGWSFGGNNNSRFFIPVAYGLGMFYNDYEHETQFNHSLVMMPSVSYMFNNNFGIRAGLSFATNFSEFNTGFVVGIVF